MQKSHSLLRFLLRLSGKIVGFFHWTTSCSFLFAWLLAQLRLLHFLNKVNIDVVNGAHCLQLGLVGLLIRTTSYGNYVVHVNHVDHRLMDPF